MEDNYNTEQLLKWLDDMDKFVEDYIREHKKVNENLYSNSVKFLKSRVKRG